MEGRSSTSSCQSREEINLSPQPGPQTSFLQSDADIALYGGAAGGGKSFALLLEPAYHLGNPDFGAVILRRTYPELTKEGGLWSETMKYYPLLGGKPHLGEMRWDFPAGSRVSLDHMQHEKDVLKWHSSQIPLIEFDELTTFTEYQFWYMLSRNRSTCGVRPYVRGGCNPDVSSWVARLVEWYVDQTTGYPIEERSGKVRWFVRDGETLRWGDDPKKLEAEYSGTIAKSFTFIPARLEDNAILTRADPGYLANLLAMPRIERERLLKGNWLISNAKGEWPAEYFGQQLWFDQWPIDRTICVIAWDPSKGKDANFGDYQAFTILIRDSLGNLWADALMGRWTVEEAIDIGLELQRVWRADGFVIEVNQFQELIKGDLIRRAKELGIMPPVYTINNTVKKEVRIRRLGPYFQNRNLRFKGGSAGARLMAEQCMSFPNGDHDDGPDSLEMGLRTMIELWNGAAAQGGAKSARGRQWRV